MSANIQLRESLETELRRLVETMVARSVGRRFQKEDVRKIREIFKAGFDGPL